MYLAENQIVLFYTTSFFVFFCNHNIHSNPLYENNCLRLIHLWILEFHQNALSKCFRIIIHYKDQDLNILFPVLFGASMSCVLATTPVRFGYLNYKFCTT